MIISEKKKVIHENGQEIPFRTEKGTRGRVSLTFDDQAVLVVTTGTGKINPMAEEFLQTKRLWIKKHYRDAFRRMKLRAKLLASIDNKILIFGKWANVEYLPSGKTRFRYDTDHTFRVSAPDQLIQNEKKALLFHSLKTFSGIYLKERTLMLNDRTESSVNQVRVKHHTSKWGSCSSKGNINLNWQLIFLEEALIDYVIIHELMHLREMNHSSRFWGWVEQYCPDYKIWRKKIREEEWLIGVLS